MRDEAGFSISQEIFKALRSKMSMAVLPSFTLAVSHENPKEEL